MVPSHDNLTRSIYMNDKISPFGLMLLPYKVQSASARLPVLQVGGHSSLSNAETRINGGGRVDPCAGCAHAYRGAGWA